MKMVHQVGDYTVYYGEVRNKRGQPIARFEQGHGFTCHIEAMCYAKAMQLGITYEEVLSAALAYTNKCDGTLPDYIISLWKG